jgi:hypothetical protein
VAAVFIFFTNPSAPGLFLVWSPIQNPFAVLIGGVSSTLLSTLFFFFGILRMRSLRKFLYASAECGYPDLLHRRASYELRAWSLVVGLVGTFRVIFSSSGGVLFLFCTAFLVSLFFAFRVALRGRRRCWYHGGGFCVD